MSAKKTAILFSLVFHAFLIYLFMTARFDVKHVQVNERIINVIPIKNFPFKPVQLPPNLAPVPKGAVPVPGHPQQQLQPQQPQEKVPIVVKKFEMISPPPGTKDGDKNDKSIRAKNDIPPKDDMEEAPVKTKPTPEPKRTEDTKPTPKTDPIFTPPKTGRLATPNFDMNSPQMKEILKHLNRSNSKDSDETSGATNRDVNTLDRSSDITSLPLSEQGNPFGEGGDGVNAYGGGAFFNSKGFDVTPWAKRVIYRIKRNWLVPAAAQLGLKGVVGVYVVFERNGRLSRVELRQSSKIASYDQSALNAFKLASPFPALPDNFPNPNMDAYFLFHYN